MIFRCVGAHGHECYGVLMRRRPAQTQHATSRARVNGAGPGGAPLLIKQAKASRLRGVSAPPPLIGELEVFKPLLTVMSTAVTPVTPRQAGISGLQITSAQVSALPTLACGGVGVGGQRIR